jgi:hypothetical protein
MNSGMNQPRVNVDLSNALDIVCEQCGCKTFREVAFIKRVSPLVSPTGKEAIVPVGTFACSACGNVNREFDPFAAGPVAKVD